MVYSTKGSEGFLGIQKLNSKFWLISKKSDIIIRILQIFSWNSDFYLEILTSFPENSDLKLKNLTFILEF